MPVTINGTTGISTPAISSDNIVGQVCFFAMQTAPTGFLVCNGTAVSRTTYSQLFAAIGTLYGVGDGATTFNLPDLRGEFIRGVDGGRGVDTGRALGSAQSSQNLAHGHTGSTDSQGAHTHNILYTSLTTGSGGGNGGDIQRSTSTQSSTPVPNTVSSQATISSAGAHTHNVTINNDGGTEARPRNVALLPCIKF
jgi:microcystin-dependent protein